MKKYRIIIAGDRNFYNNTFVFEKVNHLLQNLNPADCEIVSGGCRGVDKIGENYSRTVLGREPKVFEANWNLYGNWAGPIRNGRMAEYGTHLIAFLRQGSRGTADMIKKARENGLMIKTILI